MPFYRPERAYHPIPFLMRIETIWRRKQPVWPICVIYISDSITNGRTYYQRSSAPRESLTASDYSYPPGYLYGNYHSDRERTRTSDLLESEFMSSRADHLWGTNCLLEIVLPLRKPTMTSGSTSVVPFSVEQHFLLQSSFNFK